MTVFHRGRLFDHVHIRVADVDASRTFYRAVLAAVGREIGGDGEHHFWADEFYVSLMDEAGPSRVHLAFQAADQEAVRRFHRAGLEARGRDNGAPGFREYHQGYYGAFVLDPDGNNIEAVWHGPSRRSAASVEVEPDW
jgi:catechol 2,3-dioxygenase-like lactoylglutathione lyase family enzyme